MTVTHLSSHSDQQQFLTEHYHINKLLALLTLLVDDMEPNIGADGYSSVSVEQGKARRLLGEMKQTAEQSPLSDKELGRGVPCATVNTDIRQRFDRHLDLSHPSTTIYLMGNYILD